MVFYVLASEASRLITIFIIVLKGQITTNAQLQNKCPKLGHSSPFVVIIIFTKIVNWCLSNLKKFGIKNIIKLF